MSSFTPKEIRGLYSAYAEVHMTEEDHFASSLLEEINAVINHMVDEGWDLSEYTLEELQESFLDVVILPEIERFNEVVSQLNESTGELTEEQHEEFILEWGWALNLLGKGKKAQQAVKTTTSATSAVSKPSVLQAPLVGSKPAASTAPISAPAKPLNVTKPLPSGLSVTGGPQKGGIVTGISNWFKGLSKAKPAAKPAPTPAATPTPTPAAATPKPAATRTPSSQQGWPSIGVGDKLKRGWKAVSDTSSKIKTALTPGTKTKAVLKYGVLPTVTTGLTAAPFVSAYNLATGRPSGLQQLSGVAQGATGNIIQGTAGVLGKLGSPDAPGMYELGRSLKQAGADTQAEVERKRKSQQGTGRTGATGQTNPTTGLPVYNSYEMEGEESLQEVLGYDEKTGRWYDVDPITKQKIREVTPTQTAIDRYNRLKSQQPAKPEPVKPEPVKPEPAKGGMTAAELKAAQDAANKARQQGKLSNIPAEPAPAPAKPAPAKPAPAPAPKPEKKYQFTVGDKSFDLTKAQINQTYRDPKALGGINAVDFGRAANQAIYQFKKPGPSNLMKRYTQPSVEKESYEVVLDYLLSEGHADTVEEAHYVMMQMDAEYIQSIVEDSAPIPNIPTPTEKPKDKKKPPADTKIPDGSGYGPEEGGVHDREVRVPPNSYGDLRFPPNQKFNRGLGGPPPNTNTRPNTDPTTNTKPKPRKPLISLYPGQKGDGLMGPYIQFGNTRLGIPNISPFRPDK
jgi:hypothetical protein